MRASSQHRAATQLAGTACGSTNILWCQTRLLRSLVLAVTWLLVGIRVGAFFEVGLSFYPKNTLYYF
jgi:hypothetical protein